MTASEGYSPCIDLITHAGSPWSTTSTVLRIGNVRGFLGESGGVDLYGIYIGETNKFLKYDPTNGLQIKGTITVTSGNAYDAMTTLDTWRSGSDTTMIDGGDIYAGTVTADKITVDSAIDVGDGSVVIDGTNDYITVFSDTVTIIAGVNDDLDWTEDAVVKTADLDAGDYTPTQLAAEVQAEMRTAADDNTTCVYNSTTKKITIANSTLTTLTFKWSSGTNTLTNCGRAIGFNVSADDTGALTYTADDECALRVKMGKLS